MTTPIAYIQSRGRARRKDSRFIVFIEGGNRQQLDAYKEFQELEASMREFCNTIPSERNVAFKFMDEDMSIYTKTDYENRPFDPEIDDDEDYMENTYIVPETKAIVTKQSAVALLFRYCGSLPSDSFTLLQPTFEISNSIATGGYTCTVHLPSNAPIRDVTSKVARTKIQAKKSAAVECCKLLHQKKALTDHLLPINYKREILGDMKPVVDENGNIVGSRRRKAEYEKRIPRFWERRLNKWEAKCFDTEDGGINVIEKKQEMCESITLDENETTITEQNGHLNVINHESFMKKEYEFLEKRLAESDDEIDDEIDDDNAKKKKKPEENGTLEVKEIKERKEEQEEIILLDDMDGPFDLYVSFLEVDIDNNQLDGIGLRRLCLLTWKPFPFMPDIKLFKIDSDFKVKIHPYNYSVPISKDDLSMLKKFNLLMASSITNRDFTCTLDAFPYFLAPLTMEASQPQSSSNPLSMDVGYLMANIDWNEIKKANEKELTPLVWEQNGHLNDTILIDYADNSRKYFVEKVCHHLTPQSPIDKSIAIREIEYDSLVDFYEKKFKVEVTKFDQPIIIVRKISKVMNYLSPRTAMESKIRKSTASLVIPEFCKQFFISASVFQTWMIVPSIMTRVDSVLLAQEARKRYHLNITDEHMLTAYTTPSANMEMNYERLETLGGKKITAKKIKIKWIDVIIKDRWK